VQGKTQEAKTDLARLAKIRAEREAAQAKRKAEAEGKKIGLAWTLADGTQRKQPRLKQRRRRRNAGDTRQRWWRGSLPRNTSRVLPLLSKCYKPSTTGYPQKCK